MIPAPLSYSVVIATLDRPARLEITLRTLLAQTRLPDKIVIVDASRNNESRARVDALDSPVPIDYRSVERASSARQRNEGAARVTTPLIAFVDDDVVLPPALFSRLIAPFEAKEGGDVGGVAGRIVGTSHPKPKGVLRCYYRCLAGYDHPTYGARLFGPAINTFPCYEEQSDSGDRNGLIESEWLSSTCVLFRRDLFERERFPDFDGYSFMEDVHLSARIGKTHRLFFDGKALYEHHSAPTAFKRNKAALASMAMRNRSIVAREVMGRSGLSLAWAFLLLRLLNSAAILKRRAPGWSGELKGTWRRMAV